jgi:hypothetical protein
MQSHQNSRDNTRLPPPPHNILSQKAGTEVLCFAVYCGYSSIIDEMFREGKTTIHTLLRFLKIAYIGFEDLTEAVMPISAL